MNTFTRKTLYAAITGAAAIGVASTALAVNLSADGLGQVLIYPYYTVNKDVNGNAFNTLLSVVNTSGSTKAVKVRFREGRESVEVLDFNVFLSPFDVWTAAVTPTSAGGARIATSDTTCTIPTVGSAGADFRNTVYSAEKDNSITRTAEGYFEVFEMVTYTDAGVIGTNAKHSNGVPKDCSKVTDAAAAVAGEQGAPSGGLFGNVIILNPYGGGAFSAAATALDNFYTAPAAFTYFPTTSASPTYSNVSVPVSSVIFGGALYRSTWAASVDAVTATLLANAVTNEYVLDPGSKSTTSWVVTMPTKFQYVTAAAFAAPFTAKYVDGTGGCEQTFAVLFNREEGSPQIVTNSDFSPAGTTPTPTICWEASVLNFAATGTTAAAANTFGSNNAYTIDTKTFTSGWSVFAFNDPLAAPVHAMVAPAATSRINLADGVVTAPAVTYAGLPAIGFAAETFNNLALTISGKTYLSQFGATLPHHKTMRIF